MTDVAFSNHLGFTSARTWQNVKHGRRLPSHRFLLNAKLKFPDIDIFEGVAQKEDYRTYKNRPSPEAKKLSIKTLLKNVYHYLKGGRHDYQIPRRRS